MATGRFKSSSNRRPSERMSCSGRERGDVGVKLSSVNHSSPRRAKENGPGTAKRSREAGGTSPTMAIRAREDRARARPGAKAIAPLARIPRNERRCFVVRHLVEGRRTYPGCPRSRLFAIFQGHPAATTSPVPSPIESMKHLNGPKVPRTHREFPRGVPAVLPHFPCNRETPPAPLWLRPHARAAPACVHA